MDELKVGWIVRIKEDEPCEKCSMGVVMEIVIMSSGPHALVQFAKPCNLRSFWFHTDSLEVVELEDWLKEWA